MYGEMGVAINNSEGSALAEQHAPGPARACGSPVTGIHARTVRFHRSRSEAPEPHLPDQYQGEEALGYQRRVHDALIGRGLELAALYPLAASLDADLIVVGGTGLHHGKYGQIGSNAERVAEEAGTNVLVIRDPAGARTAGSADASHEASAPAGQDEGIIWEADARELLERIPAFARPLAVLATERYAKAIGRDRITVEIVQRAREGNNA